MKHMIRIILAAIVGFMIWSTVWLGSEKLLSAYSPNWFGVHQRAFEAAVTNGGEFRAETTILLMNIIRGSLVSILSGFLTVLVAGENRFAPRILIGMLVAFGLLVVVLTWNYIPLWYHVIFTLLLVPMTMLGGKLKAVPPRG